MLIGQTISLIFGMFNLVLWGGIAIPQIYQNYKNSSSKALSYLLFYKLFIGGIISLSIALIKKTSTTIIYIGIHHLIITTILLIQLLYYRFTRAYTLIPTENEESYKSDNEDYENYEGGIQVNEIKPEINIGLTTTEKLITIIVTPIIFILLGIVILTRNIILIETLAWTANILFTTSKFTQIYINYKTKSTRGLSKISFICMIFTDLCFMISVLSNIIDHSALEIIFKNIQWLSSCTISLVSGTIILVQFHLYRNSININ